MALLDPNVQRPKDAHEAAQALESLLLRQVLKSSGAFRGSDGVAGSETRADLFVEALSDAVTKAGGIGLARQVEQSLAAGPGHAPSPTPAPHPGLAPAAPPPPVVAPWAGPVAPVAGRVTSAFGPRADPFHGEHRMHQGVDVAAAPGTPIQAMADGVVRRAGLRGGYGLAIEIEHSDGTSTLYGHCSEVSVTPGEAVARGQLVGKVGHTGRATGDHLHFELREGGRPVDPARALKVYGGRSDMPE